MGIKITFESVCMFMLWNANITLWLGDQKGTLKVPKTNKKNDKNKHEALLYPVGGLLYLSSCELSFPKHLDLVFKDLNRV